VRDALDAVGLEPESADLALVATSTVEVADEGEAKNVLRLLEPSTTTTTSKPCTPITTSPTRCSRPSRLNRPPA